MSEPTMQIPVEPTDDILTLHNELSDPGHRSWQLLEAADRTPAMDALRILAGNHNLPPINRLKPR